MLNKKATKHDLRVFAIGILIITGLIALFLYFKDKQTAASVLAGFATYGAVSYFLPPLIKPLYFVFSVLGLILGWINTRIILGLIFFLIFTPISFFFKLTGRDVMDRGFDKSSKTYWKTIPDKEPEFEQFEKQF